MTTLLTDLNSSILTITLNRPKQANAISFEMIAELRDTLGQAARDSQTHCVVLTGAGRFFCAEVDIKQFMEFLSTQDQ